MHEQPFQVFFTALARHQRGLEQERPAITRALAAALTRARNKWPGVKNDEQAWLKDIASRLTRADGVLAGLISLRTSDLWAAHAAASGDARAVAAILEQCKADIAKTLRSMKLDSVELDEVLQRLRERVFVAEPGKQPRIVGYSGTGSLGAWLAAAATRLAIDLKRSQVDVAEDFEEKLSTVLAATEDPELQFMKGKYRREFRETFQAVFAALPREDRNLLRLTFLDGLNIDELAPMLGIHRSSVARRLAKLREHLGTTTRQQLRERFKMTGSDLDSLMRMVTSAFDVSLSQVLKDSRHAGSSRSRADSRRS
jgi:RNA polymerase sigma-70 factor (ECF subfamily)